VTFVAEQVGIAASELAGYDRTGRSIKYHRAQVREAFGFREPTVAEEDRWTDWLRRDVCLVELSEDRVRDALLSRCRTDQIEPSASSRIARVLGVARAGHESDFTTRTVYRLSASAVERLEELVIEPPWADSSTICARRQVTTDPLSRRTIRTSRRPSSSSISRTRTRSATGPV
jgi:hypothetical protein